MPLITIDSVPNFDVTGILASSVKGYTVNIYGNDENVYSVYVQPYVDDTITSVELYASFGDVSSFRASLDLVVKGGSVSLKTKAFNPTGDIGRVSFSTDLIGSDVLITMKSMDNVFNVVSWLDVSDFNAVPATTSTLGAVKVGSGLSVSPEGVLDLAVAATSVETVNFSFSGVIAPTLDGAKWFPSSASTIKQVYFSLREVSLVDTIVRLKVNGVIEGDPITCLAGNAKSAVITFDKAITIDDSVSIAIESGVGGEDLFCFVVYETGNSMMSPVVTLNNSDYTAALTNGIVASYCSGVDTCLTTVWAVLDEAVADEVMVHFEAFGSDFANLSIPVGEISAVLNLNHTISPYTPVKTRLETASVSPVGISSGFVYNH